MRISFFIAFLLLPSVALAGEAPIFLKTDRMAEAADQAWELGRRYGSQQVMVVFDADNTLIESDEPFASLEWFRWQNELLLSGASPLGFTDEYSLYRAWTCLQTVTRMRPVEEETPLLVWFLLAEGFDVRVLTGRSPGLGQAEELIFELGESRYRAVTPDKIFFAEGRDRGGEILRMLTESPRRGLIFIDDHLESVESVQAALLASPAVGSSVIVRYANADQRRAQNAAWLRTAEGAEAMSRRWNELRESIAPCL